MQEEEDKVLPCPVVQVTLQQWKVIDTQGPAHHHPAQPGRKKTTMASTDPQVHGIGGQKHHLPPHHAVQRMSRRGPPTSGATTMKGEKEKGSSLTAACGEIPASASAEGLSLRLHSAA